MRQSLPALTLPILLALAGCQSAAATPIAPPPSASPEQDAERQALEAIYMTTGGENWLQTSGWLSDQPKCTWYGVTCVDNQIVGLRLWGNKMKGELPAEIGQLTGLEILDLGGNQLTAVPPEIGQLTGLQTLDLGANQLTAVPPEIGQLIHLRDLKLDVNHLAELPPEVKSLTDLQILWLNVNQLTELPPEIGQLTSLWSLDLAANQLTGLPPEIGQLKNLRKLELSRNFLTELPPEFGQLVSLQELILMNNPLTRLPPEFGQLTSLEYLELCCNQIEELPPEIGGLASLQALNLSSNQLTGVPPEIGQLTDLQALFLSNNSQLTTLPPEIGQIAGLQMLDLDDDLIVPRSLCKRPGLIHMRMQCAYVDPLPTNSPEMTVALPDGALPCGLGRVVWGREAFDMADYPACQAAFPEVTVRCLNDQGQWTDDALQIRNISAAAKVITLESQREGICGIFSGR